MPELVLKIFTVVSTSLPETRSDDAGDVDNKEKLVLKAEIYKHKMLELLINKVNIHGPNN